jgi:protein-S-isoprenylcysteine O-methyltransferase Ste14
MPHDPTGNPPGIARHLLAILALAGTVLVVVPVLIVRDEDIDLDLDVLSIAGALLIAAALALWAVTVTFFVRIGRGTLAPWDPTRRLVVVGPYRWVRTR